MANVVNHLNGRRTFGVLPSAVRNRSVDTFQYDTFGRSSGLVVIVDVTAATGTPALEVTISGVNLDTGGTTWEILKSAALSTTGTRVLQIHPALLASANVKADALLPPVFRISMNQLGDTKDWVTPVRVATTANGVLATAYENGDTVDDIVLATGDRILLKNQTTQTENGIYVVAASGAPTRATDADSTAELDNLIVEVTEGTASAGKFFTQNTATPTIGVSNIVFAEFTTNITYSVSGQLVY